MSEVRGLLSPQELEKRMRAGELDTVIVGFTDLYGRLVGKRYDAEFFLEAAATDGSHACDYLFTVDMAMEPVPGYAFTNWEKGYGDVHLVPDLDTLRVASWLDRTALVLCDVLERDTHAPLALAPRSVLRRAVQAAAERGFVVQAASELEFFLYETGYREAAEDGWRVPRPVGWYIEDYHILQGTREEPFVGALRRHLRDSGVPVENSKGEWGLGQHELNVRYTDLLTMADRHVVYKQAAKELAHEQGKSITFMAKPDDTQAGSSCHIHLSLWRDGQNAFPGQRAYGPVQGSDAFGQFLAGWMRHVPDWMPFYAPTVNSYKRYQSGSWAPTRLAWSHDNRTAAFRVVGRGSSLRIECRLAGADCNPYLAFAAAVFSGLAGIDAGLEAPAIFAGDAYAAEHVQGVPESLGAALGGFAASSHVEGFLGPDVVEHYRHFYATEDAAWSRAVTDWERARYFEQI